MLGNRIALDAEIEQLLSLASATEVMPKFVTFHISVRIDVRFVKRSAASNRSASFPPAVLLEYPRSQVSK